ncbi:MAG: BLUF domain-containing protein [Gammaproteobacteria bacterium]|nr:BLUF domain-containing protein [Gammaproteobacteria bacterium]MDH3506798.1 BLUF domain-containing protein [Gammaproteobacteria bacterium]
MLCHLIYVSTAVTPTDSEELAQLLRQSRARNKEPHITGMLLYKGGHFMQVLEGGRIAVQTVFASIRQDRRHENIDVLREEPIEQRAFEAHAMLMAFKNNPDT